VSRVVGLAVLVIALILGAGAAWAALHPRGGACGQQPFAEAQVPGRPRLALELATTPEQHERGLMFRESMPADHGMLFVFDRQSNAAFWMRNTLIPLSVAYIDADGTILDIQDMQPQTDDSHPPARPYWYALEVNQGWYANNGVGVGDVLVFCLPG
jgi:uncharacterized membrane protein (UPF0127 family)